MKIKEIAEKIGITTKATRRFIRAGKIKATKDDKGHWTVDGDLPTKESLTAKAPKVAKVKEEKKETPTE